MGMGSRPCRRPSARGERGRVFVSTNAGVVAALDADSGQAIWAFQYDSPLNQAMGRNGMNPYGVRQGKNYPPNPCW